MIRAIRALGLFLLTAMPEPRSKPLHLFCRAMKTLLQVMRLWHYVLGVTTPEPKDEVKILFVWIGAAIAIFLIGAVTFFFIVPRVIH
jgi:hypothetical protein